ncbi:MAG: YodL domain-containing protein [Defluviitaleaceae bacterium]|nr:YodL domain-containing protein [Defluviitaleaceae bacterium]
MDFIFQDTQDNEDVLYELHDPVRYRDFLRVVSHFYHYSWRNILLIYTQMPHATKLADFDRWKEQYGRRVIKGGKTIKIKAPIEQKPVKKIVSKTDPLTGAVMLDGSGKRIIEEVFITPPVQFGDVRLLDISQTEGKPVLRLAGDVVSDDALRCVFGEVLGNLLPVARTINDDSDFNGVIQQLVFERLARLERHGGTYFENIGFFVASVTFVVCCRFGVDVDSELTAFDPANISSIDADTLEGIRNQSEIIINIIKDKFALVCKERGLDPMTLPKPRNEPKIIPPEEVRAKPKLPNEPQATPIYTTELHTETIAGVTFSHHIVKPLAVHEPTQKQPLMQTERPKLPDPPLIKYPPDPAITVAERNQYGYTRPELLPLTQDRALTLFRRDMTVYMLYKDSTEAMARYDSDITNHTGLFGVACGVWQNSREYIALLSGNPEAILEAKYLHDSGDAFAVYQIKSEDIPTAYKSYEELQLNELEISRHDYHIVYTAPLPAPPSDTPEGIFMWLTVERPDDYKGRTLAISDILSIRKDGIVTSFYANGRTFKKLLSFVGEEGRNEKQKHDDDMTKNEFITAVQPTPSVAVITTQSQIEAPPVSLPPSPVSPSPYKPPTPPALPENRREAPFIRFSANEAENHNALENYDINRRTDIDCAEAITATIQKYKEVGNRYNLTTPAEYLLDRYGKARMMWVLSKHIQFNPNGFSTKNISWAEVYRNDGMGSGDNHPTFHIATHNSILDAFINHLRKPPVSFIEKMKDVKKKSEAHNNVSG